MRVQAQRQVRLGLDEPQQSRRVDGRFGAGLVAFRAVLFDQARLAGIKRIAFSMRPDADRRHQDLGAGVAAQHGTVLDQHRAGPQPSRRHGRRAAGQAAADHDHIEGTHAPSRFRLTPPCRWRNTAISPASCGGVHCRSLASTSASQRAIVTGQVAQTHLDLAGQLVDPAVFPNPAAPAAAAKDMLERPPAEQDLEQAGMMLRHPVLRAEPTTGIFRPAGRGRW